MTQGKDILFVNGTIYIDAERKATNLLVADGKVKAIDVDPAEHADAETVDLHGQTAYPGFMDSHVHLVAVAVVSCSGIVLNDLSNAKDIAKATAEGCAKLAPEIPGMGMGFMLADYDAWTLDDLAEIDKATGDRPVLLADQTGHSYIVNSAAMKLSGITDETPDPPGGSIVRQNGKATGMMRENAGYLVGNKAIFPFIPDDMVEGILLKFFRTWASLGYTSVLELMGGPLGRILKPELCRKMEADGTLPVRVNYALCFYDLDDIDELAKTAPDTDMVRSAGLKLFVDGAAGNGGAWTTFPNTLGGHGLYGVCADDSFGEKYNMFRIIEKADDVGLDVHCHVQGDEAIEVYLAAIEAVLKKKGALNSTHTFYHLGFPTDDQLARMAKLGDRVVAGVQPAMHWGFMKQTLVEFYGERGRVSFPYDKMKAAGIPIAFSSDFPSNRLEYSGPAANVATAVTGGGDPASHPPLTVKDCIVGFTTAGRAATRMSDMGALDVGYLADLVVFDKDFYTVPADQLSKDNPKVMSTWVGGRKMYEAH